VVIVSLIINTFTKNKLVLSFRNKSIKTIRALSVIYFIIHLLFIVSYYWSNQVGFFLAREQLVLMLGLIGSCNYDR
jgi:hypothetical protein